MYFKMTLKVSINMHLAFLGRSNNKGMTLPVADRSQRESRNMVGKFDAMLQNVGKDELVNTEDGKHSF